MSHNYYESNSVDEAIMAQLATMAAKIEPPAKEEEPLYQVQATSYGEQLTIVPAEPKPESPAKGEVRKTDPTTGAQKGSKLARFDLIPALPLQLIAEHYGKGATKYADNNWRKGYNWSWSIAALERHLNAFKQGENLDLDSFDPVLGLEPSLHIVAVAWHALALIEFFYTHPDKDDRWIYDVSAE